MLSKGGTGTIFSSAETGKEESHLPHLLQESGARGEGIVVNFHHTLSSKHAEMSKLLDTIKIHDAMG